MVEVTLTCTIHKEMGKCNSTELSLILKGYKPSVIFLEALQTTCTAYDHKLFSEFQIASQKLEIKAIQIYSGSSLFDYIPVLDDSLSEIFEIYYSRITDTSTHQKLIDNFNLNASILGFQFLNSKTAESLQSEIREFENKNITDEGLKNKFNLMIDEYENSMIRNIFSYCEKKKVDNAVFMCGVAHRKSIIEKFHIMNLKSKNKITLNVQ